MPLPQQHSASSTPTNFFFTRKGAFLASSALFVLLLVFYMDIILQSVSDSSKSSNHNNHNNKNHQHHDVDGDPVHQKNSDDGDGNNGDGIEEGFDFNKKQMSPLRRNRLIEAARSPLDPDIQEWPYEDPESDGARYNLSSSSIDSNDDRFISTLQWKGKCWYKVTNFCVIDGEITLYHDPKTDKNVRRGSLRMCNEFSKSSPSIQLKYRSEPMPEQLPAPLLTKTPGWILQFWCQDLFHSTLSIMPAFHTKKFLFSSAFEEDNKKKHKKLQLENTHNEDDASATEISKQLQQLNNNHHNEPDIYLRIAKGKRHKGGYCYIKFGHPLSFNVSKNDKWSKGKQFPFNGNPYWSMYKVLSGDPWRIHPQYPGHTKKRACYKTGIIDKLYIKDINRRQAREYSDAQLNNLLGEDWREKTKKRQCKKYRITIIDRRGKTRKLTNIPEIIEIAKKIPEFVEVRSAQFEFLTLQEQIRLIVDTDLLLGVHGNGLIWQQFLQHGSCLIELVHTWYQPYAKLFGHSYFHSSIKNNPIYKEKGEFVPFAHNETEIDELLHKAKKALDSTSCSASELEGEDVKPKIFDMDEKLDYMYKDCAPHC